MYAKKKYYNKKSPFSFIGIDFILYTNYSQLLCECKIKSLLLINFLFPNLNLSVFILKLVYITLIFVFFNKLF